MRRDALSLPLAISLALSAVASPSGGPADGLSALEAGAGPPRPGILVQLTRDPAQEVEPKWSPDATSLSFASDRGGRWNVWKIAAGGGAPHALTTDLEMVHSTWWRRMEARSRSTPPARATATSGSSRCPTAP